MANSQPGCPTTTFGHDIDRHDSADKSANCVRAKYSAAVLTINLSTRNLQPVEHRLQVGRQRRDEFDFLPRGGQYEANAFSMEELAGTR